MTATVLAPYLKQRFVDANGAALYLGTVSTFQAGTNIPIVTYKDSTGIATNTNPITLNPRGECDIWLLPNVAYKFQVNDVNGNLIWTEDNVVNSTLITLYGGVDTGIANAYILNFIASFTAYVDGIQITWIPANTNTSASTINVNGLGVVNIVNPNGTALVAGEIVANQPAQILFKAGAFQLITPATTIYGTFVPVWSGFSVAPAVTPIAYRKNGTLATVIFPGGVNGTSNVSTFSVAGLPAIITPTVAVSQNYAAVGFLDNSIRIAGGAASVTSGGTIVFARDGLLTPWTAAGTKGFADFVSITYST